MNVFFLGAPDAVPPCYNSDVVGALQYSGDNSGNLIIGHSVRRHLVVEHASSDLNMSPSEIESTFDVIVISAANFIYEGFDLSVLVNFIESVRLPCVMMGVGAQSRDYTQSRISLQPGTRRFLELVSERSKLIGARGNFTADILAGMGIKNVQVTGCPSIYWNPKRELKIRSRTSERPPRVCINASRISAFISAAPEALRKIEGQIFRQAMELNGSFVAQNEKEEISISRGIEGPDTPFAKRLAEYYAHGADEKSVGDFIRNHGYVFFNVESWADFVSHFDFVCGSRLHGNMLALQNEIPAHIIAHDTRTREICELMELPFTWIGEAPEEFCLLRAYAEADYSAFEKKRARLYDSYKAFLDANGLMHRLQ